MRTVILSLAAAGLCCGLSAAPASARDYPYCLQSRELGIPGECAYQTYEQCRASASGRLASCNINPRVAFGRSRGGRGYDRRDYRDEYRERGF